MSDSIRIPIPRIPFAPPVYFCQRAPYRLVPDGNLDKDFWADAPFTAPFEDIEGPQRPAPRFSTRAKLLWDDENLYIGAVLEGNEIWAHQTEHDCVIFQDNDFEIFIDPDSDTQEYVEYEMNARNTNWDLLLTKAYRDGGSPVNGLELKGLRSAVKVCGVLNDADADNRYWSVEVVIPFETLAECSKTRKPPEAGSFYRMNFSRVQWKVDKKGSAWEKRISPESGRPLPEDNWVWAPTGVINIHYPELWAFVFFCGNPAGALPSGISGLTPGKTGNAGNAAPAAIRNERFAALCREGVIPPAEPVKWELRKLYYAEQIFRDINGCYTDDPGKLLAVLKKYAPCPENASFTLSDTLRLETTTSLFELCAKVPGTGESVILYSDGKVFVAGPK